MDSKAEIFEVCSMETEDSIMETNHQEENEIDDLEDNLCTVRTYYF